MKFILVFLLVNLFGITFSQNSDFESDILESEITLEELQSFMSMNMSKFEDYCLDHNYSVLKVLNDNNQFGMKYKISSSKYLELDEKYFDKGKTACYFTQSLFEYKSFKKQMELANYKLTKS
jgi:hypothetical protein